MLTQIYKLLLNLYPDRTRATFAPEMISVFEQRRADVSHRHALHRAAFAVREISALIGDAFRAQMESAPPSAEPWIWSLEAPVAAFLLFAFWVWRAQEMGLQGFFFPGTYLVVIGLGGLAAWLIGRECFVVRRWNRWRRAAVIFSILSLAVPFAARAVESAWATFMLSRHAAAFAFRLPGIQVSVTGDAAARSPQRGLTFSRILTHSDGRPMVMLHHTDRDAPPYLFFAALAAGAVALKARRTAFTQMLADD